MKKVGKFVYWAPRIFSILFLLFLAMFSLDVFDNCNSFLECLLGLLMHNIPVFILIILLVIAWKKEIVGAITFFLAGFLYILLLAMNPKFEWHYFSWSLIIAGPAFVIGWLFLINWNKRKNK